MPLLTLTLLTGLSIASAAGESPPPPTRSAESGTLNGGGKKKSKKKKPKKKKKNKKNKKQGGKSNAEAPPWGNASVLVLGGVGYAKGLLREAPETGEEDEAEGDSASSCNGDDCESVNSETNGAAGWGPHYSIAVAVPAVFGKKSLVAPKLEWTQRSTTLNGLKHYRPEGPDSASIGGAYVVDRADYDLTLKTLSLGILLAAKMAPKSPVFGLFGIDAGYSFGTIQSTLDSAPNQPTTSAASGGTLGFDIGLGLSFHKHAHLVLKPLGDIAFTNVRAEDPAVYPFLEGEKTILVDWGPSLTLMAAF